MTKLDLSLPKDTKNRGIVISTPLLVVDVDENGNETIHEYQQETEVSLERANALIKMFKYLLKKFKPSAPESE